MKSNALPWLVAGGAAAVIAVSAGVYLSMQIPELSSCRNPPDKTRCKDESSLVAQRNISAATTIVTGAAAVTFVTIGILQRRAEIERSRKYDVACAPGLFSVTCAGRF